MSEQSCDNIMFEMGLYKAYFPKDLLYSEIHFWFKAHETGRTRVGLTAYAARLLNDLFRIEWKVYVGETILLEQMLGEVESAKAASELYTPMAGKLADINTAVLDDPSLVSLEPYAHWLLEFEGEPQNPMTPDAYSAFLAAGWEETVKMLKGQV